MPKRISGSLSPLDKKKKPRAVSSKTAQPTYTKGQQTRARILDEAARQFAEKGVSGTAVIDVMGACGLTKGGFYAHFSSKEALYIETVRALLERERAKYQRAPESASPEVRLRAFLDWMGESLAGNRPLGRQFLWMVLEPDAAVIRHVVHEVFESTYTELRELLALDRPAAHAEVVASSLLAVALLHEQIKSRIMSPLVNDNAPAFDTSVVLDFLLYPQHGLPRPPTRARKTTKKTSP